MGTLNILFKGICTQIKLPQAVGNVLHRAVLVRANTPQTLYPQRQLEPIPPHHASLAVLSDDIAASNLIAFENSSLLTPQANGAWRMSGVRLSVTNAVSGGVTYDPSSFNVPSLTTLAPEFGALSTTVVYGTDASCHFDVTSGTFTASQFNNRTDGAWYTLLTVTTTDELPRLSIASLDGAISGVVDLSSGVTITLDNTADPGQDKSDDFYLHYLTAQHLPQDGRLPPDAEALVEAGDPSPQICFEIGPGCSNSNFP